MNEPKSTRALVAAPINLKEQVGDPRDPVRLVDGDAYRVSATRKHRAMRTRPWRTSDGETHPVTISRKYA